MGYVFDTSSFRVLNHYFPQIFPNVWDNINLLVAENQLVSVKEAFEELKVAGNKQFILDNVNKKILKGTPVADLCIIVCTKIRNGCVITSERL